MLKSASRVSWRNYEQIQKPPHLRGKIKIRFHIGLCSFHLCKMFLKVSWERENLTLFFCKFFLVHYVNPYHSKIGKKKSNHIWYLKKTFNWFTVDEQNIFQNSVPTYSQQGHACSEDWYFTAQTRQATQAHAKPVTLSSLSWAVWEVHSVWLFTAAQFQMTAYMQAWDTEHTTSCPSPKPTGLSLYTGSLH